MFEGGGDKGRGASGEEEEEEEEEERGSPAVEGQKTHLVEVDAHRPRRRDLKAAVERPQRGGQDVGDAVAARV